MAESTPEKTLESSPASKSAKATRLNLFATILTYAAPSANHHNKGDDNNKVLQTISKQGRDYPIISPYAIRDALRRILQEEELPCNRTRVQTVGAPQVEYKAFPDAEKYIDDFFFGFCVTDKTAIAAYPNVSPKRDSILRNNLAVGLSSDINTHLQQAPRNSENSPWNNISETTLLYRQVSYTAYQYPFALSRAKCISKPNWTKALIRAIAELSEVAGGNSVSYIQMVPRSIIARLTPRRVPGYNTYGFNQEGEFTELGRLIDRELPGEEFWLGGEIVRHMSEEVKRQLEANKVHLYNNPEALLEAVSDRLLAEEDS